MSLILIFIVGKEIEFCRGGHSGQESLHDHYWLDMHIEETWQHLVRSPIDVFLNKALTLPKIGSSVTDTSSGEGKFSSICHTVGFPLVISRWIES